MQVTVLRESAPGERRVAATPETVRNLGASGLSVVVEAGAGSGSLLTDEAYAAAGARIAPDRGDALAGADVLVTVGPPPEAVVAALPAGTAVVGLLPVPAAVALAPALSAGGHTAFALDAVPRTSRAQPMDALSSQAFVAGYRAVVAAAERAPRMFPMAMTAAGTVPPARVLVLGTGVAGLQAIATARRLGAVVSAYDVRAAAAEEVASLGATFLSLPLATQEGAGGYARAQSEEFLARQRDLLGEHVPAADVVVTTAAVPGRAAPVLVTAEMVAAMRPGTVVVDLAAETGGNCALTRPGHDVVTAGGVTVVGLVGAASDLPVHASALYARNVAALLGLLVRDGAMAPDWEDDIVAGCCLLRAGAVVHPALQAALSG